MNALVALAEVDHAGLVAEDAAAGQRAGRIDRQHRDPVALVDQVAAERLDERALADAGNAGDADAVGASGVRQQLHQDLLRQRLCARVLAFDQRDRPAEQRPVVGEHALDVILDGEAGPSRGTDRLFGCHPPSAHAASEV